MTLDRHRTKDREGKLYVMEHKNWHQMSIEDLGASLDVDPQIGLTEADAEERQKNQEQTSCPKGKGSHRSPFS